MNDPVAQALAASYFGCSHGIARAVRLSLQGKDLMVRADGIERLVPARPEPHLHGMRVLHQ